MPLTPEHEGLHRIFAEDKAVLSSVLSRVLKVDMPVPASMEELNVDLTEFKPVERRSDTVLRVKAASGNPADDFILLVESQTDEDETRHFAWPYYVAYLQAKYKLPVLFLVACSKVETARWARKGVRIGLPGLTCQATMPVVFGPDNVPAVTTVKEAAGDLRFAVYSALTHSRGPNVRVILGILAAALEMTDKATASDLSEYTEAGLGSTPGFAIWRALMGSGTFTYVSETRAKGRAEGEAQAILRRLERRGIKVDDKSRERITSCTDSDTLDKWLDRTFDASTVEDLFKD